jgi:hypothetical protein
MGKVGAIARRPIPHRHGRAWAGHPRLPYLDAHKPLRLSLLAPRKETSCLTSLHRRTSPMRTWPVQDAKARFSELLEICLKEGPQLVTRRGT